MTEFQNTGHPDRDWWRALWGDPADTLDALGIDGGSLVDLCCGDGYFTVEAARRCDPVYGVDLDADLLADLETRTRDADCTVDTVQADARDLAAVVPGPVDTVLLANTFHGVPDQHALAAAVHDTLVDDGRFVVVNWHDAPPQETTVLGDPRGPPQDLRVTPDATRAAVEPAGFTADAVVDLNDSHYGITFRRD